MIPLEIQNYIWNNCYSTSTDSIQKMLPCQSPIDEQAAAEIVNSIRKDKTLMSELRYWMSSMHVAELYGQSRIKRATELRTEIDNMLGDLPKDKQP